MPLPSPTPSDEEPKRTVMYFPWLTLWGAKGRSIAGFLQQTTKKWSAAAEKGNKTKPLAYRMALGFALGSNLKQLAEAGETERVQSFALTMNTTRRQCSEQNVHTSRRHSRFRRWSPAEH